MGGRIWALAVDGSPTNMIELRGGLGQRAFAPCRTGGEHPSHSQRRPVSASGLLSFSSAAPTHLISGLGFPARAAYPRAMKKPREVLQPRWGVYRIGGKRA